MNCSICGKQLIKNQDVTIYVTKGETVLIYCPECIGKLGHCPTCSNCTPCAFMEDPDPMPQFVMRAWRNQTPMGVQIIQKQVPNEERIKKFCLDGKCKCCFDDPEHPICCRFGGYATCTNYTEIEEEKFVQNFPIGAVSEN